MVQSRIILSLLPIIILIAFPFVSSQNTRGAAANFAADATAEELELDDRRRLGWLSDLLKKLAQEAKDDTDAPTISAAPTTTAPSQSPVEKVVPAGDETSSPTYYPSYVPTRSPVKISPLKKKKKDKKKKVSIYLCCSFGTLENILSIHNLTLTYLPSHHVYSSVRIRATNVAKLLFEHCVNGRNNFNCDN